MTKINLLSNFPTPTFLYETLRKKNSLSLKFFLKQINFRCTQHRLSTLIVDNILNLEKLYSIYTNFRGSLKLRYSTCKRLNWFPNRAKTQRRISIRIDTSGRENFFLASFLLRLLGNIDYHKIGMWYIKINVEVS